MESLKNQIEILKIAIFEDCDWAVKNTDYEPELFPLSEEDKEYLILKRYSEYEINLLSEKYLKYKENE